MDNEERDRDSSPDEPQNEQTSAGQEHGPGITRNEAGSEGMGLRGRNWMRIALIAVSCLAVLLLISTVVLSIVVASESAVGHRIPCWRNMRRHDMRWRGRDNWWDGMRGRERMKKYENKPEISSP